MKTYKKLLITLASMTMISGALFGCNNTEEKGDPMEPKTKYEEIYKSSHEGAYNATDISTEFMAKHGYKETRKQGHNNWFYKYVEGGSFQEMPLNKEFEYSGASLKDEVMTSTKKTFAAREFSVTRKDDYRILSSIKLAKGSGLITVKIYKGSDVIDTIEFDSSIQQSIYVEKEVSLNVDDKVRFVLESEATIAYNPILVVKSSAEYVALHQEQTGYWSNGDTKRYGDVHPYYYDGKMYMYYLATDGGYNSLLSTSTDMINYYDEPGLHTNKINPPSAPYYVLGVCKVNDYFRSVSGYSRDVIWGSKSKDLLDWEAGEGVDEKFETTYLAKVGTPDGARDPYLFYDPDLDVYRIIYLGYYNKNSSDMDCCLMLTTSTDNTMQYFKPQQKELLRFDHAGASKRDEPECPMVAKIGNRWYVFGSLYGQSGHGVGALSYWMSGKNETLDEANFAKRGEFRLDGQELCAAQLVQVGDRWYMYGWIPTTKWGGGLNIAREVFQKPDGTLGGRLDPYLTNLLNKGNLFNLKQYHGNKAGVEINENGEAVFSGSPADSLPIFGDKVYSIDTGIETARALVEGTADLTNSTRFGFKIYEPGRESKGSFVFFNKSNHTMNAIDVSSGGMQPKANLNDVKLDTDVVNLKVVLEGRYAEFFVNDEYALSVDLHTLGYKNFKISAFIDGTSPVISKLNVSMLSDARFVYDM